MNSYCKCNKCYGWHEYRCDHCGAYIRFGGLSVQPYEEGYKSGEATKAMYWKEVEIRLEELKEGLRSLEEYIALSSPHPKKEEEVG